VTASTTSFRRGASPMKWPFLETMLSTNILPYIDYALSQHLLKDIPEANEAMACFLCHLSLASRSGHLCIMIDNGQVFPSPKELWPEIETNYALIHALIVEGSQQIAPSTQIVREENRFYFQKYWSYETQFLHHFNILNTSKPSLQCDVAIVQSHLDKLIEEKKLLNEQASAIKKACENCLTLICGGPGTGKTYTASYLIKIFFESLPEKQKQQCEIALAAPTGKAASNLQGSLGKLLNSIEGFKSITAKTLHNLLGLKGQRSAPTYLTADLILIDESSMVDVKMMVHLFASIKPGARLILLGDKHQLPPVESGSLFADMIPLASPANLIQCLRTELQEILELAHAVNSGNHSHALNLLNGSESMRNNSLSQNCKADLKAIVEYASPFYDYTDEMEDEKLIEKFNRFRILSPLRKGPFGVDEVNAQIKRHLTGKYRKRSRMAAPIMILTNDARLGVFNGEVGLLVKHHPIDADFKKGDYALFPSYSGGLCRKFPAILLPKFEYAYCLSVHKSQGSEFDNLLLLLPEGSEIFGREVLYTAITRARKKIEIYSKEAVLQQTIERRSLRLSGIRPVIATPFIP
jgi:exodeoxyribonuclease V alpha subunit